MVDRYRQTDSQGWKERETAADNEERERHWRMIKREREKRETAADNGERDGQQHTPFWPRDRSLPSGTVHHSRA